MTTRTEKFYLPRFLNLPYTRLISADRRRNKISNKAVVRTNFPWDLLSYRRLERGSFTIGRGRFSQFGKFRQRKTELERERENEREKPQARNFVPAAFEHRVGTSCENYLNFVEGDAGSGDCRWHTISHLSFPPPFPLPSLLLCPSLWRLFAGTVAQLLRDLGYR